MFAAAAATKSLQSCLTLWDPIDGSPRGSPIPGILQARTLEWVAIAFSNAGKWKVKVKSLSPARLLATPWTAAHQAPPSMGFSRQEYWSGVPLPSPYGILHNHKKEWNNAFSTTWMDLEMIILSQTERERQIQYDITYMRNLKCEPIYKTERLTDTEDSLVIA